MSLAITEADLQKLLDNVQFTCNLGLRLNAIADGECVLDVPIQAAFERPGGIVSGQVFMAAADVAMWLAIMTKLGMDEVAVTAEMKTNFLSGARQKDFLCKDKILKLGRRLVYDYAECTDRGGKLLTHHSITYIRPEA